MSKSYMLKVGGLFLVLVLCIEFGSAVGQQMAPIENKGVALKQLSSVDLGAEIEGMDGRQLRMLIITIEPGGVLGLHSHKGRPDTAYMLQGKVVEHIGDVTKEISAGDAFASTKETSHWLENKGTTPAIFIAVDIFKQP